MPRRLRRIQGILVQHIRQRLPELRAQIEARETRSREELVALGAAATEASAEAARAEMLRLIGEYNATFDGALHGQPQDHAVVECSLLGGARIRHVFQDIFAAKLDELDPCAGLSDEQARAAGHTWTPPVLCTTAVHACRTCTRSCSRYICRPLAQIFSVLNNSAGVNQPLIVAKEAFEVLVRKSLRQLRNPGLQCLEARFPSPLLPIRSSPIARRRN